MRKCLNASRTDSPRKINKGSVTVLSFLNIYFVLNYVCDVCVSLWDIYRCLSREKSASDLKLQAIVSCPKWGWEANSNPLSEQFLLVPAKLSAVPPDSLLS